ncbi:MAG TPA: galactokinase [Sphingobacteriaceae bacterium]|nr:galactokinase [Sphingobacteriaceae bacterium]
MLDNIIQTFKEKFQSEPSVFRSPGRVNLIGEHTDYNDGFVLPAAIDKALYFAIAPNKLDKCRIYSYDLDEYAEFSLLEVEPCEKDWLNYLLGVVSQFQKASLSLTPFDIVYGGNIPIGAGVSSSAAVECGLAYGLNEIFTHGLSKLMLAKMAQKAEHEYAHVMCGIMDQFANLFGKRNHVVRLDCRSLEYEYYNFDVRDYQVLLCDTGVKHSLASSEYNTRRKECEEGVRILQKFDNSIKSLRDVNISLLKSHKEDFSASVFKRCCYVVNEIRRVQEACNDLQQGNLEAFGQKMFETHHGLQHDYEVSCAELDFLIDEAKKNPAVIGARMMGGGFGGCTINLVKQKDLDSFINETGLAYKNQFNIELKTYITEIVDGTGPVN